MLTSRARLSVGVFSLGVHRLTCRCEQRNLEIEKRSNNSNNITDRYSNSLWLRTRNQMPNWLRRRWSCWSSSLLSNSMLSREWWEADRPIWRRRFSSNSRCSAWISASFRRLEVYRKWEGFERAQREGHMWDRAKEKEQRRKSHFFIVCFCYFFNLNWCSIVVFIFVLKCASQSHNHMLCNTVHIPDNGFHGAH